MQQKPAPVPLLLSIDDAIERLGMGLFQYQVLLAAGLCFAADSMEILLLTFLAEVLEVHWGLTDDQIAHITSSVFIGAMIGTLVLGPLGDRIGRKPVFSLTAGIITVFGLATAFVNSYPAVLLVRFLVGFGVGGLTVPFDTLAEFLPVSQRRSHLLIIEYFWTGGTLLVPVVAYFSLGHGDEESDENSWRYFIVLCALPCLVSTIIGLFLVPESPEWLMTQKRQEEAVAILRQAATVNGKDPDKLFPPGTVLVDEAEEENGSFCYLLSPTWRWLTLNLWACWGGLDFTYYGAITAVTLVFNESSNHSAALDDDVSNENGSKYAFDYLAILISASAEAAGATIILPMIDRFGIIPSASLSQFLAGLMVFILCFFASQEDEWARSHKILAGFLARMFFMSGSCAIWLYTVEILPTEIRTTGHSASNAIARLCASLSPHVVKASNPFMSIGSDLLLVSWLTALCTSFLPDTKGLPLGSFQDQENHIHSTLPTSWSGAKTKLHNQTVDEEAMNGGKQGPEPRRRQHLTKFLTFNNKTNASM